MTIKILVGHVLDKLAELPDESVHCVVTSPPYYGLRSFGTDPVIWGGDPSCQHQWGEQLWIDPYGGAGQPGDKIRWQHQPEAKKPHKLADAGKLCRCGAWRGDLGLEPTVDLYIEHLVLVFRAIRRVLRVDGVMFVNIGDSYASSVNGRSAAEIKALGKDTRTFRDRPISTVVPGVKPKDLLMVPAQLALALRADGWWLRSEIVWAKSNPMPESVEDRPTCAHEKIFLLTRSARYFYDAEAVREPHNDVNRPNGFSGRDGIGERSSNQGWNGGKIILDRHREYNPAGRNMRNIWWLNSEPFPEAHFATFPAEIPRRAILAGCPEGGTVLDPFNGSGVTTLVADQLLRNGIGIELNPDYARMAEQRLARSPLWRLWRPQSAGLSESTESSERAEGLESTEQIERAASR